ncbi:MAG: lipoprotein-releasing system permease protein [Halieaceae bacterium]|jgi:lipoprotein-releasing system permease protein
MGGFRWTVGWRYTFAGKLDHIVSFLSLLSILGMVLAVALLILVLSIMNGFDREMRERILALVPHVTVHSLDPIEDWPALVAQIETHPGVKNAAPFVQFHGMLLRGGVVETAIVTGISPQRELDIGQLTPFLGPGVLEALVTDPRGLVLGAGLARRMDLTTGDAVRLLLMEDPQGSLQNSALGGDILEFTVSGILDSGTEVDESLALLNFERTYQRLQRPEKVLGARVVLKDLFSAPQLAWELVKTLPGPYYATDWMRSHGNLYQAIQLSRNLIGVLLVSIIAVAAFNVVASLVLVVIDKQADIAVLRSLGATPRDINAIFIVQGLLIGLVGCLGGTVVGLIIAPLAGDFVAWLESLFAIKFLSSDVYPINYLPVDVRWSDIALINIAALAMSFLASLIPARRAALVAPAQALRWE